MKVLTTTRTTLLKSFNMALKAHVMIGDPRFWVVRFKGPPLDKNNKEQFNPCDAIITMPPMTIPSLELNITKESIHISIGIGLKNFREFMREEKWFKFKGS